MGQPPQQVLTIANKPRDRHRSFARAPQQPCQRQPAHKPQLGVRPSRRHRMAALPSGCAVTPAMQQRQQSGVSSAHVRDTLHCMQSALCVLVSRHVTYCPCHAVHALARCAGQFPLCHRHTLHAARSLMFVRCGVQKRCGHPQSLRATSSRSATWSSAAMRSAWCRCRSSGRQPLPMLNRPSIP